MKHRSPLAVFFLPLITFGIYGLYWQVSTKGELNRLGADIPTAWLLIVPLANLYWIWKYAKGVEQVSGGKTSAALTLLLMILLGIIGMAILQSEFNDMNPSAAPGGLAGTGVPPAYPTPDNGGMPPVGPADPMSAAPSPVIPGPSAVTPADPFGAPADPVVSPPAGNPITVTVAPSVDPTAAMPPTDPTQPVTPIETATQPTDPGVPTVSGPAATPPGVV